MRSTPPVPGGFGFPSGVALGALVTTLVVALGATGQPVLSLVGMVAVVDIIALTSTARAALGTAAVCWALHTGFVLGREGELEFTARSGGAALVLGLCALTALGLASLIRSARTPLHERPPHSALPRVPAQRQPVSPART